MLDLNEMWLVIIALLMVVIVLLWIVRNHQIRADVRNEDIDGLTTLGILGDRYNANLLMLSFTYSLQ